jgi:hypothetical protein
LLRDLPFDAIQFCIYEQLRIVCRKLVKRDLVDAETAIIGAASGMDNTLLISFVDGTQQSY